MELIERLKNQYKNGNLATRLIFINVAIYIVVSISSLFSLLNLSWLALPPLEHDFIKKPWTILTYFFLHVDFFHLFFNMLMLYFVGNFFYQSFTDKVFAKFYFLGGIAGGILFLIYSALTSKFSILLGASAAIYSVFFAMAAYQPHLKVRLLFFNTPFKLIHIALGLLVLGFFTQPDNIGGNIAHLGGALFGYFYMKNFEKGNDIFDKIFEGFTKIFQPKSPLKTYSKQTYNTTKTTPPRNDYDYNEQKMNKQQKIDAILDKISRSGYNSLTPEEKEFLFQQGKLNK